MSNFHTSSSGPGSSGNGSSFISRREAHGSNTTGSLPIISTGRSYTSSFDFENMIASLRELFARDRQIASQPDSSRCGICYLYFSLTELQYREQEGYYVCTGCERTLMKQVLPMLRRQQK